MECAKGQFVAFVDSDDWIHKDYFSILMKCQEKNDYDAVICEALVRTEFADDEKIDIEAIDLRKAEGIEAIILNYNAKCRCWGRIYKKQVIDGIWFPENISLGEDTGFNIRAICAEEECNIAIVEKKLYYYYMRNNSAVHILPHDKILDLGKWYLKSINEVKSKTGKKIFIEEAYKAVFAARYLSMFKSYKGKVHKECKSKLNDLSKMSKELQIKINMEYKLFSKFPSLYRLYRIITDKTMIEWEKKEKAKYKMNEE